MEIGIVAGTVLYVMSKWQIRLFGGLQVSRGDAVITQFPTKRSGLILARLALTRQGAVGRDELAEALWPEDFLDATRIRLRQELKRLRDALGDAADLIQTDRTWVRMDFDQCEVDLREFERQIRLAKANDNRLPFLRAALEQYSGPLLPEFQEDWVVAARQENRSRALLARCEVSQELRLVDPAASLEEALSAVRQDPSYEPAVVALIRAFQATDDQGSARRAYQDYERLLQRDRRSPSEAVRSLLSQREELPTKVPELEPPPAETSLAEGLPSYSDSFHGRQEECDTLRELLDPAVRARLITILGPAGVGKSRLAVQVAENAAHQYETVSFVTADEEPISGLPRRLEAAAAGKPALIVLDNVEPVLPEVAEALTPLLARYPQAKVLATSRQRIGLGTEQVFAVPVLRTPMAESIQEFETVPSVALFLSRARQIRPDFALAPADVTHLALLLNRLDGLPLAIELAAARAATLSIRELSSQTDERFTWLTTKRMDLPARQRSLWAAIEASYLALPEETAFSARAFAVFRGGVTRQTAKDALGREAWSDLEELVDRSLIFPYPGVKETRYRMLDSIRDFLVLQSPEAELADLRRRHAASIAKALLPPSRELVGPRQVEAFNEISEEYENACAALKWSAEEDGAIGVELGFTMWRFFTARARPLEGYHLLSQLSKRHDIPQTWQWGEAVLGMAVMARLSGFTKEAQRWLAHSADLFRKLEMPNMEAWALANDASLATEVLDFDRALYATEEVERLTEGNGHLVGWALNAAIRANALAGVGRVQEAVELMEKAFAIRLQGDQPGELARGYRDMAAIYRRAGQLDRVRPLMDQAVVLLRDIAVQDFLVDGLLDYAEILHDAGEPIADLLKEIDTILARLAPGMRSARRNLLTSRIRLSEGRRREAAQAISQALTEALRSGSYAVLIQVMDAAAALTRAEDLQAAVDTQRRKPDPEVLESISSQLAVRLAGLA